MNDTDSINSLFKNMQQDLDSGRVSMERATEGTDTTPHRPPTHHTFDAKMNAMEWATRNLRNALFERKVAAPEAFRDAETAAQDFEVKAAMGLADTWLGEHGHQSRLVLKRFIEETDTNTHETK